MSHGCPILRGYSRPFTASHKPPYLHNFSVSKPFPSFSCCIQIGLLWFWVNTCWLFGFLLFVNLSESLLLSLLSPPRTLILGRTAIIIFSHSLYFGIYRSTSFPNFTIMVFHRILAFSLVSGLFLSEDSGIFKNYDMAVINFPQSLFILQSCLSIYFIKFILTDIGEIKNRKIVIMYINVSMPSSLSYH